MAYVFDAIRPFDAAYVSILILIFVIFAFICQRKTWIWLGITTQFLFGVAFITVPDYVLKYQVHVCV